jgi:micrococcal nuclease
MSRPINTSLTFASARVWARRCVLGGLFGCAAAYAAGWTGAVTHISDGDTLWVRRAQQHEAHPVRIDGIDAPEICQAFGPQARAALSTHLLGQRVHVTERAHDQYGRMVARVTLGGDDVGAWMVQHGYAWSYRYHSSEGPYKKAEAQARKLGLGLFAEPDPMPPREFRRQHGSCHTARPVL